MAQLDKPESFNRHIVKVPVGTCLGGLSSIHFLRNESVRYLWRKRVIRITRTEKNRCTSLATSYANLPLVI